MRGASITHANRAKYLFAWVLLAWCVWSPSAVSQPVQWGCGIKVKAAQQKQVSQALDLYQHHRYREASQLLRRVASKNPRAAEPYFWLGMCAVADGFNTAGIRKYFSQCLELCPEYPDARAHFYCGVILYTDERYDEAIAAFERYFALANNSERTDYAVLYDEASNYLYWSQFLSEALLNTAPFDPYRVRGVSSRYDETLPYLSADGRTFYYLRRVPVRKAPTVYARELDEPVWRLCSSTWQDTAFSKGTELPAPFNSGDPEGSLCLTADGAELYYSRITNVGGYANSDLYVVYRQADGSWGKPQALSNLINGAHSWESQPTVSPDGKLLIFASNRKGGQGGIDLWRCHRLPNGDWSRPENLGPTVNTIGNEKAPFLAADGHTLYFLSDGWQGFGGYDIYFTNLADRYGNRPTNLGLPINTESDELSFGVSADGKRAYFGGRVAESRSTDVLMFDLYPKAQPDPMQAASITLASTHVGDTLTLRLHRPGVADAVYTSTGRQLVAMLPLKGQCLVTLTCGSAVAIDYTTPQQVQQLVHRLAADTVSTSLVFEPGSRLAPSTEQLLQAWAAWLLAHPRVHASVECPKLTDARAAYNYLVSKCRLRPERLSHRGGTDVAKPRIVLQGGSTNTQL